MCIISLCSSCDYNALQFYVLCQVIITIRSSAVAEDIGYNHVCSKMGHAFQYKSPIHSKKNTIQWIDYIILSEYVLK